MYDISVIIVNWNTRDFLKNCLISLFGRAISDNISFDIWVVDNASQDGSADMVKRFFPQVNLIANPINLGYAAANNQAIRRSTGRYVFLLNPDIIWQEGTLNDLVKFMDGFTQVAALGCKLLDPDGSLQYSCRSFPTPDCLVFEFLFLSRLFPKSKVFGKYRMSWWDYSQTKEVDQPMGSALMLRRRATNEVGLLDEDFPIFFNDVDLC